MAFFEFIERSAVILLIKRLKKDLAWSNRHPGVWQIAARRCMISRPFGMPPLLPDLTPLLKRVDFAIKEADFIFPAGRMLISRPFLTYFIFVAADRVFEDRIRVLWRIFEGFEWGDLVRGGISGELG